MLNLAIKWFGLFLGLVIIVSVFFFTSTGSTYALSSDSFNSLGNWGLFGAVQPEKFYCLSVNCVKLTSGGQNGFISQTISVEMGATYRVRAFGTVHNAANVPNPATVELMVVDGTEAHSSQCGDNNKNINCVGGGTPNYKELTVEKKATTGKFTIYIKGWAGGCNASGCSEGYIDDFFIDKIADPPESQEPGPTATPALTPTPSPTSTLAPTATPKPTQVPKPHKTPTPTPSTTPTPTITPSPTPTLTLTPTPTPCPVCPTSTPTPTLTVTPTSTLTPTPQVLGAKVEQLPKTGLPLGAWVIVGLLPAGMLLRRLGNQDGRQKDETARSIWQKRQFKKEE